MKRTNVLITAIFIVLLASCKPKVDETFWETELEPKMIDALKISSMGMEYYVELAVLDAIPEYLLDTDWVYDLADYALGCFWGWIEMNGRISGLENSYDKFLDYISQVESERGLGGGHVSWEMDLIYTFARAAFDWTMDAYKRTPNFTLDYPVYIQTLGDRVYYETYCPENNESYTITEQDGVYTYSVD